VPAARLPGVATKVARLVKAFTVPVPKTCEPLMKDTVPLGLPPNAPVTLAVNVTVLKRLEGFREEVNVVLVAALTTVCVSTGEVLPANLALPI
jgi:hypothetical protein